VRGDRVGFGRQRVGFGDGAPLSIAVTMFVLSAK
jgi:hypothetical protein